jgi:hypothetical protein
MKMIVTGIVAAIAIAVGANLIVGARGTDRSTWEVYSTPGARVGDPGENLVGPSWTGVGQVGASEDATAAN